LRDAHITGKIISIESNSSKNGIIRGEIDGRRWDLGLKLPWIDYQDGKRTKPHQSPDIIYRITNPFMQDAIVGDIQTELLHRGFDPGQIDNFYGYMTEAAVRAYQLSLGLVLDGEVGNETAKSLGIELDLEAN
jgi:hypothetical protein